MSRQRFTQSFILNDEIEDELAMRPNNAIPFHVHDGCAGAAACRNARRTADVAPSFPVELRRSRKIMTAACAVTRVHLCGRVLAGSVGWKMLDTLDAADVDEVDRRAHSMDGGVGSF